MLILVSKKQILNFQINLGHIKGKWIKFFDNVILGIRNNFVIFNIDHIILSIKKGLNFIQTVTINRSKLFFISSFINNKGIGMSQYIINSLKKHGFFDGKFIGGIVSNIKTFLKKKIKKKKIVSDFLIFGGLYPSCAIIGDSNRFFLTVKEASYLGIPSISIIDSDLDSYYGFYSIYGNNESRLIHFFLLYINFVAAKIGHFIDSKSFIYFCFLKRLRFFFQLRILYYFFKYFKILYYFFNSYNLNFFKFFFIKISNIYLYLYRRKKYMLRYSIFTKIVSLFFTFFFIILFIFFIKYKKYSFKHRSLFRLNNEKKKYLYNLIDGLNKNYLKNFYLLIINNIGSKVYKDIKKFLKFFNSFFFFQNKNLNYFFFKFFFIRMMFKPVYRLKRSIQTLSLLFLQKINYLKVYSLKGKTFFSKVKVNFFFNIKKETRLREKRINRFRSLYKKKKRKILKIEKQNKYEEMNNFLITLQCLKKNYIKLINNDNIKKFLNKIYIKKGVNTEFLDYFKILKNKIKIFKENNHRDFFYFRKFYTNINSIRVRLPFKFKYKGFDFYKATNAKREDFLLKQRKFYYFSFKNSYLFKDSELLLPVFDMATQGIKKVKESYIRSLVGKKV